MSITEEIQIRKIEETDALLTATLSSQLGSAIDGSVVLDQIVAINSNKDHSAFVAVLNNQIVGYIHAVHSLRLTTSPFIEIIGLIVNEKYRRNGIASRLVRHLEEHIDGDTNVRVRCNVMREAAHEFYLNMNYEQKKTQKVFEKGLDNL